MPIPKQLLELQTKLERLITDPEGLEIALWRDPQNQLDYLNHQTPLDSFIGLNIYAEGYFIRLASHLKKSFARTYSEMGENAFYQAAAHYYAHYPSRHPQLQESGRSFPAFLSSHAPDKPWLFELTQLELCVFDCLRSDEASLETYIPLHQTHIDPQQVLFLNPNITYFTLNWSVLDTDITTKLPHPSVGMIVWKHQGHVQKMLLNQGEYELLECLHQNLSIEQTCELWGQKMAVEASGLNPEKSIQELQSYFFKWAQMGVILGIGKQFEHLEADTWS